MAIQSEFEPYVRFEERNRIAEELHDRICPHLFGIVCALHAAEQEWNGLTKTQQRERLKEIGAAASTASRELRSTIYGLGSPESGGGTSWVRSVESLLASQATLNGVRIRFRGPDSDRGLSIHHQKALYRIIAEGVGNAIRHGGCSAADVKLTLRRNAVTLRIADNGKGFDASAPRPRKKDSGFGLTNMKTLASSLGGNLRIDSEAGNGTRIVVRLPLADVETCEEACPLTQSR